jgi:CBS domain containing-hemolysin-like protein
MESSQEQHDGWWDLDFSERIDFGGSKDSEVMVPRTEIVSVQETTDIKDLNKKL